jgi:hypothetical protein
VAVEHVSMAEEEEGEREEVIEMNRIHQNSRYSPPVNQPNQVLIISFFCSATGTVAVPVEGN